MPSSGLATETPTLNTSRPAFSEVIVPRHLHRSFTYAIPARLQDTLTVGSLVLVPFGPSTLQGVVIALSTQPPGGLNHPAARRLREILSLLDDRTETGLDRSLLELTRQISEHYLAPWGQCLRLILPTPSPRKPSLRYVLTETGRQVEEGRPRLSPTALAILARLAESPKGLALTSLQRALSKPVARALTTLKQRGLVGELQQESSKKPTAGQKVSRRPTRKSARKNAGLPEPVPLPPVQAPVQATWQPAWQDKLRTLLDQAAHHAILLQAPAAERLACLLQAIDDTLTRHRTALVIAPEIARVVTIAALATTRWGERVATLHSALTPAARDDAWRRIRAGTADVVVGTRSAVLAPFPSGGPPLGLLFVEQEEDPSLKEEQEPHYHAREVAWMRARQQGAVLVLGSAHPSLETLHREELDRFPPDGATDEPASASTGSRLAAVLAVDLRKTHYGTVLSEPLIAGMREALETRSGRLSVILFLNRKGFAPLLLCRDCGASPHCPRCSVSLTFYRGAGRLACHYCGAALPLPDTCPSCLAPRLDPVGSGTERIEEEVRRLFPQAKIGRLDRDRARTPAQVDAIHRQASSGELDILIGTQMLFQGAPLPRVPFVGLPHADAGLHVPDFRSAERTYHALLDAIDLAQPEDAGGKVVLQTYLPTHHAIASVVQHNPATFYEQELPFRQALGYPPFTHLISLHVSGKHPGSVKAAAERWAGWLKTAAGRSPGEVTILGPIPAPVAQRRGLHRWQILIKSGNGKAAHQTVQLTLDELERTKGQSGLKFDVDVDPLEMM